MIHMQLYEAPFSLQHKDGFYVYRTVLYFSLFVVDFLHVRLLIVSGEGNQSLREKPRAESSR